MTILDGIQETTQNDSRSSWAIYVKKYVLKQAWLFLLYESWQKWLRNKSNLCASLHSWWVTTLKFDPELWDSKLILWNHDISEWILLAQGF